MFLSLWCSVDWSVRRGSLFDGKAQDSTQLALALSFTNLLGLLP